MADQTQGEVIYTETAHRSQGPNTAVTVILVVLLLVILCCCCIFWLVVAGLWGGLSFLWNNGDAIFGGANLLNLLA